MTKIILVRHGETEYNTGQIFRGRKDIPLNETGHRQAKLLGQHFKKICFEAIYSSPLKRSFETANHIANYHRIDVVKSDNLIDLDYGKWEGLTDNQVQHEYPLLYNKWITQPQLVTMPNGETLEDVKKRTVSLMYETLEKYSGTILLVSHRVALKILICYMRGLKISDFWNVRIDLGSLTIFKRQGNQFILNCHNNVSHLDMSNPTTEIDF